MPTKFVVTCEECHFSFSKEHKVVDGYMVMDHRGSCDHYAPHFTWEELFKFVDKHCEHVRKVFHPENL